MSLINNHIYSNRNEKAIEYLNTAIAKDSNNPQLTTMGRVYETGLRDYAKAEEYFLRKHWRSIRLYRISLTLGRVYYNQGVNKHSEANMINDAKQYQEELAKLRNSFFASFFLTLRKLTTK